MEIQNTIPFVNETWFLSLCYALVPLFIYFLNTKIRSFILKSNKRSRRQEYTACDSPECVRCSKYQAIRSQAFDKLCEYVHREQISTGLERIFQAVENTSNEVDGHPEQKPNILYVPGLDATPWWSKDRFQEDINLLEKNTDTIYAEYVRIYEDLLDGNTPEWAQNKTHSGQWNVYYFYNQGVKNVPNCTRCPSTSGILDQLQNLMKDSLFFNVSYSVLHADTIIDEHYGPTNTRIRCHLGLAVPDDCSLKVAGKSMSWKKGKCLLFDDSFLHSAYNNNVEKRRRVVLLLDFWHPQLTRVECKALLHTF